jgi:nucleoid DNA-binding protein
MEKYLIELLETNNRVIVPDLGAFIIRQQEPRELVFNDLLAFNDGMLTSHIKQQEGISMSKAQVKIEEFVDQVKKVLTKGDIYHLENLGYLKMDDSSKIEFSLSRFPAATAKIVSAATLSQEEDSMEETTPPVGEEAPKAEITEEETPEAEIPEEEALEAGTEWKAPDEDFTEEETTVAASGVEDVPEKAADNGSFTLEDLTAEIEVDAAEDKPLIPDAEEPPFLIEEPEHKEQQRATVVGTSQARLEAAAAAAMNDEEKMVPELEKEPLPTAETSIPYYVGRERSLRSIWPWIGGAVALIIILLVAAWFFFPDELNRILAGKSAEQATTEETVSGDYPAGMQGTTGEIEDETAAQTEPDQEDVSAETEAPGTETGEDAGQEAATDQTGEEAVEETVAETETEPEPEPLPAGQAKKYYIVAGMFSSRANAEDYVNTLKTKGFDAELFGRKNNLYGVSFSSHVSRSAAMQELTRIREQFNPEAWLLHY